MYIEPIPVVGGSERWAPNWRDRAWMIMQNKGSGATGDTDARPGDVTCLLIVGTTTYIDEDSNTVSVGYEAKECTTTNAPAGLMLGAWHGNTPLNDFGKVQCHGWDHDALIKTGADKNDADGSSASAQNGEPHALSDDTATPAITGSTCTIVELVANMTNDTEGNHAVYWRC